MHIKFLFPGFETRVYVLCLPTELCCEYLVYNVCYWATTKGQWYTAVSTLWLWAVSHGSYKPIAGGRIESSWFYFSVENWSRKKAKHFVSPQDLVIPSTKTNTSLSIPLSHWWWERNTFWEPTGAFRWTSHKNKRWLCLLIHFLSFPSALCSQRQESELQPGETLVLCSQFKCTMSNWLQHVNFGCTT